ncbi:capsular biosynthesis protein [Thermodesulfobacterium sp. TA1]|uniref:capsular biosynthesis protein n=1 Tax=Thermodesulfobacterium sp. TA1 TaxID=2234087 RepID=UPI001231FEB5|nr:capsular biosynthesis protein [Thermodesulfobacterium sp. TA1]QER41313.1 capsular biosynthesis protein [Thermodesulfobacterium sp. TA1]
MKRLEILQQFQNWQKNNNLKEVFKNYPLFFLMVVLPIFLVSFYYLFIASDKYVSEAKITIKQTGQPTTSFNIPLFGIGNPVSREDAMYLKAYILSYDMLDYLDKKLNLKKMYQSKDIDFISRLSSDVSHEEFLKYYQKHIVKISYDDISSILTIQVFAFKPEDAKMIAEAILEQCERYINGISHKIAREQMNFIEQELAYANQKMQNAKNTLLNFQNTYKVLDPTQEAQASASLVAQLEVQLAQQEAQLRNLLTYLNEDSFQVQALKNQIKSLKEQIEKEKSKMIGGDRKLNKLLAQYLELKLNVDFAVDVYKATLSAFETTRVEASRKLKNLVVISSPNLPDEALYPKRAYNIALASLLILLFYGITKLVIGIIKEHRI